MKLGAIDGIIVRLRDEIIAQTGYRPFQDGPQRQLLCDALTAIDLLVLELHAVIQGAKVRNRRKR